MTTRRTPLMGICRLSILIGLALAGISATASASQITENYGVYGLIPISDPDVNLQFSPGGGGFTPATEWNGGTVLLGAIFEYGPNPNWFPGGIYKDIVYKDVPFTIQIDPAQIVPGPPPGYHITVTGPASDGAIIHGVINGVLSDTGKSSLVATLQSVTPNDMAAEFANRLGVTYVVDPTLPNPFPAGQIVLPRSVQLNLGGFTDITVTTVPEPSAFFAFVPLAAVVVARSHRSYARARRNSA